MRNLLDNVRADFPPDLKDFLATSWLDGTECHVSDSRPGGRPVFFFLLMRQGSGQQTFDAETEVRRSRVIAKLAADGGVKIVFQEGLFRGQEMREPVQLRNGTDLGSPTTITRVGIDDVEHYRKSSEALRKWVARLEVMKNALATLTELVRAYRRQCSSELQVILEAREQFGDGTISLGEYVKFLYAEAEGTAVDLERSTSFVELWEVLSGESEIDFKQAEEERQLLMRDLANELADPKCWICKTLDALAPGIADEASSVEEIQEQAGRLAASLEASPEKMRQWVESQLYRTAMYAASRSKPDRSEDLDRSPEEKDFVIGMLRGPTAIGELIEKKHGEHLAGQLSRADMYHFVIDLAMFAGFPGHRIPNVLRYARYAKRYESILTGSLFEEIDDVGRRVAREAAFSRIDRDVVEAALLLEDLRSRVLLEMIPGKGAVDFSKERAVQNIARKLRTQSLLKGTPSDIRTAEDVLDDIENISRDFYAGSVPRAELMAKKVMDEMESRGLDRAIVSVGGFHFQSMMGMIAKKERNCSFIVVLPFPVEHPHDWSAMRCPQFEDFAHLGEGDCRTFEDLPERDCSNVLCRNESHGICDRMICLTSPGSRATFYCATCRTWYCGLDLEKVAAPRDRVEAIPENDPLRILMEKTGAEPFGLRCWHCGNFIGRGDKTILWGI